jgi:hypothetical protein
MFESIGGNRGFVVAKGARAAIGAIVALVVMIRSPRVARADVHVERAEGADACPDTAALRDRIREVGPAVDAPTAEIKVRFERTKDGYRSSVQVSDGKYRSLVDNAPSCDGVAEATALAVKLALDLEAARPPAPVVAPPVERASTSAKSEPASTSQVGKQRAAPLGEISLSGVVAFGIASPVASGVRAGAAVVLDRRGHWTLGLTGLTLPAQSKSVGKGSVDLSVQGAGVEGCGRSQFGRSVLIALCGRVEAMRLEGEARGFDRSENHAKAMVGGTLLGRARATVAGPIAVFVEAGALAPFVRQRFSIDTVGVIYDPPVVAVATGIGIAVDFE